MKTLRLIPFLVLAAALPVSASAQQKTRLGENAALRYWSAFAQMQDSAISDEQARELNLILDGTAPYSDLKYKALIEKNRPAFETMARGTALPNCDWGLDYQLGSETPAEYVRKALTLGRLNVLYVLHLGVNGDRDEEVRSLAAGLRFSHDVAHGGTLFASVVAKQLLADHLRVTADVLQQAGLSQTQRSVLRQAVAQLGPEGLDWRSNVTREVEILRDITRNEDPRFPHGLGPEAAAALARIAPAYIEVLDQPSSLPGLQQMIASAPQQLREILPNPKRMVEAKQDLAEKLSQLKKLEQQQKQKEQSLKQKEQDQKQKEQQLKQNEQNLKQKKEETQLLKSRLRDLKTTTPATQPSGR